MSKCPECGWELPDHRVLCTMDREPIVEELPDEIFDLKPIQEEIKEPIIEELSDNFDIYKEMVKEIKEKLELIEKKYNGRVVKVCELCRKDFIVSKHQLSCPMASCPGILGKSIKSGEDFLEELKDKYADDLDRIEKLSEVY